MAWVKQWPVIPLSLFAISSYSVTALAEAGEKISKSMSQNIQLDESFLDGIQPEAAHAYIKYLSQQVSTQRSDGALADPVEYKDIDGNLLKTRPTAKPLIGAFMYGPVDYPEQVGDENVGGFVGHGKRDTYAAVSLDDGNSWKTTNLSDSARETSFKLANGEDYPGDVTNVTAIAAAGNYIAVAWQSRYCQTGTPAYALDDTEKTALADYLVIDNTRDLYLTDLFGVGGSQGSVNYSTETDIIYPSVGEVPYNCLWVSRGVLLNGDDPRTGDVTEENHVVWYKPERLTSGRRDVNRIEIAMVKDAGVALTWQEDPDGLRSGRGLGPGEGWSGATAHSQTDIWYSFLPYQHFETVTDATNKPVSLIDYWIIGAAKPKPYVPFAVPMRLTNNARCGGSGPGNGAQPWCESTAASYGLKNQCVQTISIPTGPRAEPTPICVTEDGLPNVANTAATRARLSLQPKLDANGNTVGAWVVVVAEEDKGLGSFYFKVGETAATATACEEGTENCQVADDGKNAWYFSFDMGIPKTSADLTDTGLVRNLLSQGNMLNQPEIDWRTGQFYPPMDTANMWNFGTFNFKIHRTEIARRGSLLVQPTADQSGERHLLALPLFKQGQLQQGGPADIFARRIINAGVSGNPYDFRHLVCQQRLYEDGSNPYYPQGICLDPAINISGTTPKDCISAGGGNDASDGNCPSVSADGVASDDPEDQRVFDRLNTWIQCPGSPLCGSFPVSTILGSNLDDQSWYNPLDVAKGHRGYLWRDLVVVMYAWSPNWKLNRVGNDRWELYIRRSFDGGKTWTTTPTTWGGSGTTTCDFMRDKETTSEATQVCTTYSAGAPEQARNVTQLQSTDGTPANRFTILDPRYAPDPPTMKTLDSENSDADSDQFNPSRFFVVYETGDNSTTEEGEAESLDLFYGRAVHFGDHYQVWSSETDLQSTCLPGPTTAGIFCNEFDRLTTGSNVQASEASLIMSPSGDTLYSAWTQGSLEPVPSEDPLAEAKYARVWYSDPYINWSVPTIDRPDEDVMGSNDDGPTDIPGDADGDGDVDLNDINLIKQNLNKSLADSSCGEICDLNNDGIINVLDLRLVALVCTRPGCITE